MNIEKSSGTQAHVNVTKLVFGYITVHSPWDIHRSQSWMILQSWYQLSRFYDTSIDIDRWYRAFTNIPDQHWYRAFTKSKTRWGVDHTGQFRHPPLASPVVTVWNVVGHHLFSQHNVQQFRCWKWSEMLVWSGQERAAPVPNNVQDWCPHSNFISKGSQISALQVKRWFKSTTSIWEYRNEIQNSHYTSAWIIWCMFFPYNLKNQESTI